MNEQLEFVKLVTGRLDSAGVPYMLTGSMAMAFYAEPRMTRDLDLVVACHGADADKLTQLFAQDCYVSAEAVREATAHRGTFNIIHQEWITKADFIVRKDDEYRRTEFERRRSFDLDGFPIYVAAPEDLILSKLLWARESRSEFQLRDVRSIVHAVAELDQDYLQRWAEHLEVAGLLSEASV